MVFDNICVSRNNNNNLNNLIMLKQSKLQNVLILASLELLLQDFQSQTNPCQASIAPIQDLIKTYSKL